MIDLPNNQQRILVIGKTGTGKTCAGVWHLSMHDFKVETWIVLNHKGDDLIDSIHGAEHVDLNFRPNLKKKKGGLYIYHPVPIHDDEAVTQLLWDIHAHGNIGVYIDEGYMIPNRCPAFQALLTQGRSKHIPMIILTQRPVYITRFAISESDFFQVFYLSDKRDRQIVSEFIGLDLNKFMQSDINSQPVLKKYHSIYFNVAQNMVNILTPVPTSKAVLSKFNLESVKQPKRIL